MDMSQYRDLFLSESREHLSRMNDLVVVLEQHPDDGESLNALFREAHSIKGMAAAMGFQRTARLAHHLEDSLDTFRNAGRFADDAADRLLNGIDLLEGLVEDIASGTAERDIDFFLESPARADSEAQPASPSPVNLPVKEVNGEPGAPASPAETEGVAISPEPDIFQVQISLSKETEVPAARGLLVLRELESRGEIVASDPDKEALLAGRPFEQVSTWFRTTLPRQQVREMLLAIPDVEQVVFAEDRRGSPSLTDDDPTRTVRVRTDLLDRFVNLAGELITHRHMLQNSARERDWQAMDDALERTSRLVDDLHHHVLRTRLMPLASIAGRLPRIVRDLARKTGKNVAFRMIGGEVGLDRVVLDQLADPLVHLVRNAVDHGICDAGEVMVNARRERDLVLVEVRDNGVGIDPAAVRAKAVEKGLLGPRQADELSDRETFMLICRPGFSTATEITETSGRGVGMDVVKAAVENLGGTLEIESAPQKGTIFRLRLPLSIAIIKLVLVRCCGMPLALPVTRVLRIVELAGEELQHDDGKIFMVLDEERIPVTTLASLLGLVPLEAARQNSCIVLVELQGATVGLQVDDFVGHRDAFVKSLGFPFNLIGGLSGASIEGDGSVLFIVDPQPLLAEWSAGVLC